jgi:tetratricopeptide (TPR) repeat protein
MDASLRYVDRAPPKEAALIRAWKAHLDGRDDEALARYGALLADFPEDVHALFLSGLIHLERGAVGVALPFFEKVLALDPGAETSLDLLVSSLGALRRHERLKGVVADAAGGPPTPAAAHAVVRGLVWLGDAPAAVEAARRALAAGGGPSAAADLAGALSAAGRYAEQEVELRRRVETEPFQAETWYSLAGAVRAQGRRREALRLLDGIAARVSASRAGVVQYVRAMLVAGDGDGAVLWRESAKAAALYPAVAGDLAVVLALAGDLAHAAELGARLPEGSTAAEEIAALSAWHRGDVASAVARLAALDARDPWPQGALPPSYLLVEVSAAAGDASGTLSAVARLRSLWPRGIWRSWAMPRSAYLAAAAHAELADLDAARAELSRLVGWLEHADPDLPLAREARALQARLAQ